VEDYDESFTPCFFMTFIICSEGECSSLIKKVTVPLRTFTKIGFLNNGFNVDEDVGTFES
jgi:hypothetical protein